MAGTPQLLILGLVIVAWVISMVDVAMTNRQMVRNLPKEAWFFYVMLFPALGGIVWMLLGRPPSVERAMARQLAHIPVPTTSAVGPEDTPEWAAFARALDRDRDRRT